MLPTTIRPSSSVSVALDPQILLDAFLEGLSSNTLRTYRKGLQDFAEFLGIPTINEALAVLVQMHQGEANLTAHKYRSQLLERKLSPSTINGRLAALRSAVKMARTFGHINWQLDVPSVRGETLKDTRGPGVHVIREMIAAAGRQGGGMGLRDTAMLRLLFDLALRRNEVVSLDVPDVDLEGSRVAVSRKGGQRTYLTLTKAASDAIAAWLDWYEPSYEGAPLFINFDRSEKDRNHKRLTGAGLYAIVRKLGKAVDREVHPHALRHTAVTQAVEAAQAKGFNLQDVRRFSGHKNVSTLMVYVDSHRDVQGDLASAVSGTVGE